VNYYIVLQHTLSKMEAMLVSNTMLMLFERNNLLFSLKNFIKSLVKYCKKLAYISEIFFNEIMHQLKYLVQMNLFKHKLLLLFSSSDVTQWNTDHLISLNYVTENSPKINKKYIKIIL
jgi:hypothetical protein